jgi:hypothetical protein
MTIHVTAVGLCIGWALVAGGCNTLIGITKEDLTPAMRIGYLVVGVFGLTAGWAAL